MHVLNALPCPECDGCADPNSVWDPRDVVECKFCNNTGHVDVAQMMDWLSQQERLHEDALEKIRAQKQRLIEAHLLGAGI